MASSALSAAAYMRSTRKTFELPKMDDLEPYRDRNVLVFAPHQDDDTLGCGGTIRRLVELGAKVTVVYMTDGGKGSEKENKGLAQHRQEEAVASLNVLGCRSQIFLGFEDGALDMNSESLGKVIHNRTAKAGGGLHHQPAGRAVGPHHHLGAGHGGAAGLPGRPLVL